MSEANGKEKLIKKANLEQIDQNKLYDQYAHLQTQQSTISNYDQNDDLFIEDDLDDYDDYQKDKVCLLVYLFINFLVFFSV